LINVYDPTFWAQETLMQVFPQLACGAGLSRLREHHRRERRHREHSDANKFTARTVDPDNFASNKPKADNVQVS